MRFAAGKKQIGQGDEAAFAHHFKALMDMVALKGGVESLGPSGFLAEMVFW